MPVSSNSARIIVSSVGKLCLCILTGCCADVAVAHAGRFPAVHELEREGVPLVVAADVAGHLLQRHRFIYAAASDLRVADVAALLVEYKACPSPSRHAGAGAACDSN